ncbi:MAG: branched-chain amino acid ABC transporter permease [Armatimonadetes bacterium]|nr:branched-chain amino acid ABC transporter permease [Armatimonadota bacterium]
MEFVQHLINGLYLGGTYALIALGYTMVYGVLRLINFAHGDVVMVGAYVALFAAAGLHAPAPAPWYQTLLIFLLAMAACALLGMLIERVAYRPLRQAPRLAALITAIGVSVLLENGGQLPWVFGSQPRSVPELVPRVNILPTAWGLSVTPIELVTIGVTLALMVALQMLVQRTRIGKAMRACSMDREAAYLMGIPVNRVILVTFALGSALAAAAGMLIAVKTGQAHAFMGLMLGLKAFVAAVVGGIGSIPGAMVGGFSLGMIEEMVAGYGFSSWRDAIAFVLLILILLVRPTGIMGRAVPEKV